MPKDSHTEALLTRASKGIFPSNHSSTAQFLCRPARLRLNSFKCFRASTSLHGPSQVTRKPSFHPPPLLKPTKTSGLSLFAEGLRIIILNKQAGLQNGKAHERNLGEGSQKITYLFPPCRSKLTPRRPSSRSQSNPCSKITDPSQLA
ncbi:hypothetical protein PRUPE_3G128700 [Prunus persica]|uniref:Uncharacterized protein n=1 Tax=Prunus persica TaxID=3760 RepID=M5XAN9_PRUPE|nr:hypothetical protein PRUPE_3G128700 [Prunus persica]